MSRSSSGRFLTCVQSLTRFTIGVAMCVIASPAAHAFVAHSHTGEYKIPIVVQEPQGYAGNPSTLLTPLRQDLTSITINERADGKFDVKLQPGEDAPGLQGIDLRVFVPRVPALAKGDATLTRIALFQRELNRNETQFGPTAGTDDFRMANNCLRMGLWEVMLAKKRDSGMALDYHGWFSFPKELYARLFTEINRVPYEECESYLEKYPNMGGFEVPLAALRKVERETEERAIDTHLAENVGGFGEQKRKAKLISTPGTATYGDFVAADKQPITVAKFSEPGFYDKEDPVKFDLHWLATPKRAIWRKVHGVRADVALDEVEIDYENGNRLVLAHEDLSKLTARTEAPKADADVVRMTFGISTPEIYASVADRTKDFDAPKNYYLFLLDAQGKHVDNHATGVDRLFAWREQGTPNTLHVVIVGYERITFVSHLSLPWRAD